MRGGRIGSRFFRICCCLSVLLWLIYFQHWLRQPHFPLQLSCSSVTVQLPTGSVSFTLHTEKATDRSAVGRQPIAEDGETAFVDLRVLETLLRLLPARLASTPRRMAQRLEPLSRTGPSFNLALCLSWLTSLDTGQFQQPK